MEVSFTHRPDFFRGRSSRYPPNNRQLGGLQSWARLGGKEKRILVPAGNETPVEQSLA